jgi:type I restriction enzyme S subunit
MICQVERWKDIDCWIPATSGLPQLRSGDYVPLSQLLSIIRAPIDLKRKPIATLNVIRKISFGGAIEVRTNKEKEGYKGNLFLAESGFLIISKINFIHGSFCVVPDEVGPMAVSSEYPCFEIDRQRILPDYLDLILRTEVFKNQLTRIRSGSAKKRVQATSVLNKAIPLPSLGAQRKMLAAYKRSLNKAVELEAQARNIEQEAQKEFEAALGVAPAPNLPKRPFQVAWFKDIDRWSHEGILQTILHDNSLLESEFEIVLLGEIATVTYGLQKCPANRPGKHARPYLRVANVQRGYLDLQKIKMINVPDADIAKYRLEDGDVLLCEGNSADLVGRGAIWRSEIEDCVHQNHVLRVRLNQDRVLPDFILAYINSSAGQSYFRSKAKRTTNLASINSKEVFNLPVPLPAKDIQVSCVHELRNARMKVKVLQDKAAEQRLAAWNDFMFAVFA